MRRAISIAQVIYVIALVGLLAARLPSLSEHEPPSFSVVGFFVGAGIAVAAFGIGSLVSKLADDAVAMGSELELWAVRGSVVAGLGAMTAFTALIYLAYSWLFFAVAGFVILGIVCVVGAQVARVTRRSA